jgi:lysophospholipase L1-like esterase
MIKKIFGKISFLVVVMLVQGVLLTPVEAAQVTPIDKIRVSWDSVPNAVMYELVITDGKSAKKSHVVTTKTNIYTTGYELDVSFFSVECNGLYWKVRGLDINKQPITNFTEPKLLTEAEINPVRPKTTTQFDKLPYAKLYPVYSWIPVLRATDYDLQVFYDPDNNPHTPDTLLKTDSIAGQRSYDYYDDTPYRQEGSYWWRVRARNSMLETVGAWSDPDRFKVEHDGATVAAFGDSITHGGGAVSTPPSDTLYDWETYSKVPIRNLGLSGNTVENMVNRFNDDVLPFHPKILVVFGGINNIRLGDKAAQVISGLNRIKYKCLYHNIIPVFVTVAPINPMAMKAVSNIDVTPGWEREQMLVNSWIRSQRYYVDITGKFTDDRGWLFTTMAVDGLHPDVEGKKIIGTMIGDYLVDHFSDYLEQK